jgi:hypothetical protein
MDCFHGLKPAKYGAYGLLLEQESISGDDQQDAAYRHYPVIQDLVAT